MTAPAGAWQGGFATFPRPGGYALEAFLEASSLDLAEWTLARGGRVVDIALNVSRSDGAVVPISECPQNLRLGQFYLRIDESYGGQPGEGAPWFVPTAFCTPVLD